MKTKIFDGQLSIFNIDMSTLYKKIGKQLVMKNENGGFMMRVIFPAPKPREYIKHNDFDYAKVKEIESLLLNNNLGLTERLIIAMMEEHSYKKTKFYLDNIDKLNIKTVAEFNSAVRENKLNGVNEL